MVALDGGPIVNRLRRSYMPQKLLSFFLTQLSRNTEINVVPSLSYSLLTLGLALEHHYHLRSPASEIARQEYAQR